MAYTLTGKKGGKVRFEPMKNGVVDRETENYTSSVTSNPIEKGSSIDDHVNNDNGTFAISGVIVGGDTAINALKTMRDSRDIITYTGRARITDLVFTALKFDYSYKNRDGAAFTATLKKVQITTPSKPEEKKAKMSDQDAGKSSNKQLAPTANSGMMVVSSRDISAMMAQVRAEAYNSAYQNLRSSAPLSRKTGGYNGY